MESLDGTGAIYLFAVICHSLLNNVKDKKYRDVGNGMWQEKAEKIRNTLQMERLQTGDITQKLELPPNVRLIVNQLEEAYCS